MINPNEQIAINIFKAFGGNSKVGEINEIIKSFPDKGDPDYIEKDKGKEKVKKVMDEWKSGKLNSSSGDPVKDRKQAIAIALSEAGLSKSMDGEEVEKAYNENKDLFSDYEEKEEKGEDKVSKAFNNLIINNINQ